MAQHYYIEGQRIVSKSGGGFEKSSTLKAGKDHVNYPVKQDEVRAAIVPNLKFPCRAGWEVQATLLMLVEKSTSIWACASGWLVAKF